MSGRPSLNQALEGEDRNHLQAQNVSESAVSLVTSWPSCFPAAGGCCRPDRLYAITGHCKCSSWTCVQLRLTFFGITLSSFGLMLYLGGLQQHRKSRAPLWYPDELRQLRHHAQPLTGSADIDKPFDGFSDCIPCGQSCHKHACLTNSLLCLPVLSADADV